MPPAVEIARAIGATPVSLIGHGVDQGGEIGRRQRRTANRRMPWPPPAAGRSRPARDWRPCAESSRAIVCLSAPTIFAVRSSDFEIGPQGDMQRRLPRCSDRLAQLGRQRIDRAALDAGAGDDGFAADGVRTERQRDALERLALEAVAEDIGPGDGEAAIGRPQRRYLHAFRGEQFRPTRRRSRAAASLRRRAPARSRALRRRAVRPAFENADGPARPSRSSGGAARIARPCESSRRSQARSKGDALKAFGNTRPLEPTKVGCPSASLQSRKASGGNASIAAFRCGVASR